MSLQPPCVFVPSPPFSDVTGTWQFYLQRWPNRSEKKYRKSDGIPACFDMAESPQSGGLGFVPIRTAGVSLGYCLGVPVWAPGQCGAEGLTFRSRAPLRLHSGPETLSTTHS